MAQVKLDSEDSTDKMGETLWAAVMSGTTIRELKGVSTEIMDGLYAYAYDFYEQGRLDEAATFFRFLCIYDFYNPEYIMGMAAVHQLKKEYHQAADLYAVAFALAKSDYRPMFYSGQCLLALRRVHKARQCFEIVLSNSDNMALKQQAQAYLDLLQQTASTQSAAENKENSDD